MSGGEPENLDINTEADEMFPFIIGNDLFFSSNRDGGAGDLDIYWIIQGGKEPLKNIDQLNTAGDDHGIFINSDHTVGYFAKRDGKQDDIFQLKVTRTVTVTNELAGQFTYRNLGTEAAGLELQLLDEDDVSF